MFLLFYEACFCELSLELAKDLLLAETLPPEFNQGVNLVWLSNSLDALSALAVKLVDQHLNETTSVRHSSQCRRSRTCRRAVLVIFSCRSGLVVCVIAVQGFILSLVRPFLVGIHTQQFDSRTSILNFSHWLFTVGCDTPFAFCLFS